MLSDSVKHGKGKQMNSFIVETEDGKWILIDGGWRKDGIYLLEYLQKVTGKEKPHIDAWFLTHAHQDHICCFLDIVENHMNDMEIDSIYYNFPSIQLVERREPVELKGIKEFYRLLPNFVEKAVIVSKGDCYQIGDATFDILYSPNCMWSDNAVNNSSVVMRMVLAGKKVMFLADMGLEGGRDLLKEYGDELKSDYCQMAHHGQNGVGKEVYAAIKPECCLWCTPDWLWDNDNGEGFNTYIYKTVEVRKWVEELGVKKHFVAKDGDQIICL